MLVGKLQANRRRNALTRALHEYGRVAKTLFVLRNLDRRGTPHGNKPALKKETLLFDTCLRFLYKSTDGRTAVSLAEACARQRRATTEPASFSIWPPESSTTSGIHAWDWSCFSPLPVCSQCGLPGSAARPRASGD